MSPVFIGYWSDISVICLCIYRAGLTRNQVKNYRFLVDVLPVKLLMSTGHTLGIPPSTCLCTQRLFGFLSLQALILAHDWICRSHHLTCNVDENFTLRYIDYFGHLKVYWKTLYEIYWCLFGCGRSHCYT